MASRFPKKNNTEELDVSELAKDVAKEAEGIVQIFTKYASEGSNPKQIALGGVSGWVTGYVAMKIGKTVATAVGGSLILLQIAHHKGYISVDWSKVNKDLEGASKKIAKSGKESSVSNLIDKAADYLDDKAEKAERILKKKKTKARRWYRQFVFDEDIPSEKEYFYFGFAAGSLTGVLMGWILELLNGRRKKHQYNDD